MPQPAPAVAAAPAWGMDVDGTCSMLAMIASAICPGEALAGGARTPALADLKPEGKPLITREANAAKQEAARP